MYTKRFSSVALACIFCIGSLLAVTGVAHAGGLLVGTHMGFTYFSPEDGDGVSVLAFPGNASLLGLFQPGLRIGGFIGDGGRQEIFVDTDMTALSTDGSSLNTIQVMVGYQHCFSDADTSPFVDVGAGILHVGNDSDSHNAMVLGGGVGVRHTLAHGHGAVRAEAHLDHQFESKDGGFVVLQAFNAFGLKLGFDLYMK